MKRQLILTAAVLLFTPLMARAQGKLNVITTTEDLASIAREVGGDHISVAFEKMPKVFEFLDKHKRGKKDTR